MIRAALAFLAGLACALLALPSASASDGKRTVAVLEFRAGSTELRDVGSRVSSTLRAKTSLMLVDGNDARKAYGPTLDDDVAACRGSARCIAKIGQRLRADEVLLIGVSEFGDVILTLQRIGVDTPRVLTRIAEALAPGASPSDEQVEGYLKRVMPRSDFLRWGVIRIAANVAGAEVVVGKKPRGTTPIDPVRVAAPDTYDIEVRKEGYVPFHASVAVPPDAEVDVRPVLQERSDAAWYRRWWVAAIAGTVVVGAVTVGVLATRDGPSDVPVVGDGLGQAEGALLSW